MARTRTKRAKVQWWIIVAMDGPDPDYLWCCQRVEAARRRLRMARRMERGKLVPRRIILAKVIR